MMKVIFVIVAAVSLAFPTHAQSLADVAKKTEEERAKAKQEQAKSDNTTKTDKRSAGKVYTNKDLPARTAVPEAASAQPLVARQAPPRTAGASGCEAGHWIESVGGDGEIIKLEDGSLWRVDGVDTVTSMLWLPVSDVVVCGTKMINVDDAESVAVTRLMPTPVGRVNSLESTARGYLIQSSGNDETFVINGEVFKAKTYCFNFDQGDRVVFVTGSPVGACASAQLLNIRTGQTCNVWCQ